MRTEQRHEEENIIKEIFGQDQSKSVYWKRLKKKTVCVDMDSKYLSKIQPCLNWLEGCFVVFFLHNK